MAERKREKKKKKKKKKMEVEQSSSADFCNFLLPEACISIILSLTSPKFASTSSLVSSTFRSAADSDIVWENFLPSDYKDIISSSLTFSSKKELYFQLCDHPILIDGGSKSFSIEKWSGKKCYMIGARSLSIIWGDTPQYWKWNSVPESRFEEVAQLLNVCWLEIRGNIDTKILSPKTTYGSYLVFKFAEVAHGFNFLPIEVSVKYLSGSNGDGGGSRIVYLDHDVRRRRQLMNRQIGLSRGRIGHELRLPTSTSSTSKGQFQRERGDGWMEIEMGEFFNDTGEDGEVQMRLLGSEGQSWKRGLIIQGIDIRPKESQLNTNG